MSPGNENAPAADRGARKILSHPSKPQAHARFNKDFEHCRNAAACFPNRDKSEEWHTDFIGVTAVENLPTGSKVWINIRERIARNGQTFFVVSLKPFRSK